MQVSTNSAEAYGKVVESIEPIVRIIARYTEVEKTYLVGNSALKGQLTGSLFRLYTAVLKFLIAADDYFGSGRLNRMFRAVIPTKASAIPELMKSVDAAENDIRKVIPLVQAEGRKSFNRLLSLLMVI